MINMTNVEYIDYFEKIIANEPENILSLYFVQKLMSDVRFRSFQPMISAELQKKILKMVLPKLKNQFKINRLVDFNPIGVADEEIEILNKESVTDVGTFVKTLDDGKVCKEIENLQIDKVSFYCLRVVYEGKCVYLLRQFSTFIIWPMKKRIKKNEKSSQHRSQNFRFSPLAEMASEAKM